MFIRRVVGTCDDNIETTELPEPTTRKPIMLYYNIYYV